MNSDVSSTLVAIVAYVLVIVAVVTLAIVIATAVLHEIASGVRAAFRTLATGGLSLIVKVAPERTPGTVGKALRSGGLSLIVAPPTSGSGVAAPTYSR